MALLKGAGVSTRRQAAARLSRLQALMVARRIVFRCTGHTNWLVRSCIPAHLHRAPNRWTSHPTAKIVLRRCPQPNPTRKPVW